MKELQVHILATVLRPAMLDATLLVFRTLRKGFPTARVRVWGNALSTWEDGRVGREALQQPGVEMTNLPHPTSHDAWLESLIEESAEPFWIVDTDMVFWGPVEQWFRDTPSLTFAGRYEPEFHEEWTGTRHMARLHTCLMWINPAALRMAMWQWAAQIPLLWRKQADFPFVRQHFVPFAGGLPLFYDTMAGMHQAIGGHRFTTEQNAAFEHLHCGSYADQITAPSLRTLRESHALVYQNLQAAHGFQKRQNEYYAARALPPLREERVQTSGTLATPKEKG